MSNNDNVDLPTTNLQISIKSADLIWICKNKFYPISTLLYV